MQFRGHIQSPPKEVPVLRFEVCLPRGSKVVRVNDDLNAGRYRLAKPLLSLVVIGAFVWLTKDALIFAASIPSAAACSIAVSVNGADPATFCAGVLPEQPPVWMNLLVGIVMVVLIIRTFGRMRT